MIFTISFIFFQLFSIIDAAPKSLNYCGNTRDEVEPLYLKRPKGTIYSPGYRDNQSYPEGIICTWVIVNPDPDETAIVINFEDFELDETPQCEGDSLTFGSISPFETSPEMVVCGQRKPRSLYMQDSVLVDFRSDMIYSGRGFNLKYRLEKRSKKQNKFQCRNREWIHVNKICDGKLDCDDGTDEESCKKNLPIAKFDCGKAPKNNLNPTNLSLTYRVFGGDPATEGSWPWQVSLQFINIEPNGHFCGGSLIHPQFVVTAAHCVEKTPADIIRVVVGLNDRYNWKGHEQVRYVHEFLVFPDLSSSNPDLMDSDIDMVNDIALIKLNVPVVPDDYVNPICIGEEAEENWKGDFCFITGWGDTRGTGYSSELKQLEVKILDPEECEIDEEEERETEICIKSAQEGLGACSGDSGGPLVCKRNGKWLLLGDLSRGGTGTVIEPVCGGKGSFEIYASIVEKKTWIEKAMKILSTK